MAAQARPGEAHGHSTLVCAVTVRRRVRSLIEDCDGDGAVRSRPMAGADAVAPMCDANRRAERCRALRVPASHSRACPWGEAAAM